MALWKEQGTSTKDTSPAPVDSTPRKEFESRPEAPLQAQPIVASQPRPTTSNTKESLIAEELTIEGKIEGAGHVRIAGRFKGDIHVQGNLAIEPGAALTGAVRANTVTIAGQLQGNIDSASRVELLSGGVLDGDLHADSLTVAAGSRMRGKVEFGWPEKSAVTAPARSATKVENTSAA